MPKMEIKFVYTLVALLLFSGCGGNQTEIPQKSESAVEDPEKSEKPNKVNAPFDSSEEEIAETEAEHPVPEFFPWNCQNFEVDEGSGIGLFYEWTAKTVEQNEEYFIAAKHTVYVNNVPITPYMDGLNGVETDGNGNSKQLYWIDLGMFPAGTYDLQNVIEITEPVFDGWDWYGPDSDYEILASGCTFTVLQRDFDEVAESNNENTCEISSPIRENWNTVVCDTFDGSSTLWLGTQEGTTTRLENGEYIIDNTTAESQGYKTGFTFPISAGTAPDHLISVEGKLESNFRDCTWGVYVRSTDQEIVYFFMINNEGRYMLTGSTENDAARFLGNIDSGPHSAIDWDGLNNITAVADGRQLEFYINDELVLTHEANNDSDQQFGVIVWGGEGVSAFTRLDNLLVRVK